MYQTLTKQQQAELDSLQKKHKLIRPKMVVDFARNPKAALHSRFTWDDSEAAEQYRLDQARHVLRIAVFVPEGSKQSIRTFVSLRQDRSSEGGYRATIDVLSDAELRAKMLEEALAEFRLFERKYRALSEFIPVFKAAARVRARRQKAEAKPSSNGRKSRGSGNGKSGKPRRRKPAAALA